MSEKKIEFWDVIVQQTEQFFSFLGIDSINKYATKDNIQLSATVIGVLFGILNFILVKWLYGKYKNWKENKIELGKYEAYRPELPFYIDPEFEMVIATDKTKQKFRILEFFRKQVLTGKYNGQFFLIEADAGMGKSFFTTKLIMEAEKQNQKVRFNIPDISALLKEIEKNNLNQQEEFRKTILFLDGLDEVSDFLSLEELGNKLKEIQKVCVNFKKVIVGVRKSAITAQFRQKIITENEGEFCASWTWLSISPFQYKDVKKFVGFRYPLWKLHKLTTRWRVLEFMENYFKNQSGEEKEEAHLNNPLLLKFLLELDKYEPPISPRLLLKLRIEKNKIYDKLKDSIGRKLRDVSLTASEVEEVKKIQRSLDLQMNLYTAYNRIIHLWSKREATEKPLLDEHKENYQSNLKENSRLFALEYFKEEKREFSVEEFRQLKEKYNLKWNTAEGEDWIKILEVHALFTRTTKATDREKDAYFFMHGSIYDYFLADVCFHKVEVVQSVPVDKRKDVWEDISKLEEKYLKDKHSLSSLFYKQMCIEEKAISTLLEYKEKQFINDVLEIPNLTQIKEGNVRNLDFCVLFPMRSLKEVEVKANGKRKSFSYSNNLLLNIRKETILDLSNWKIPDVKPLYLFAELEELNLSGNEIKDISLFHLFFPKLTRLNLRNNQITDISALEHCTDLTHLDLRDNQITDLSVISKLTKLTHLQVEGNPELTQKKVEAIVSDKKWISLSMNVDKPSGWEKWPLGMEFIKIPRGKFTMGFLEDQKATEFDAWAMPALEVEIDYDYWMARNPVQWDTFQKYMEERQKTEKNFKTIAEATGHGIGVLDGAQFVWNNTKNWKNAFAEPLAPVIGISYYDAIEFCNWLTEKYMGKSERVYTWKVPFLSEEFIKVIQSYYPKNPVPEEVLLKKADYSQKGFRLPFESEWEYAVCGRTTDGSPRPIYYWGNDMNGDYAWYGANSERKTHPVGVKYPNAFGLYDMLGNVWEWCEDYFHEEDYADWKKEWEGKIVLNPRNIKPKMKGDAYEKYGVTRAIRGGSWSGRAGGCRLSNRSSITPEDRGNSYGFRILFLP